MFMCCTLKRNFSKVVQFCLSYPIYESNILLIHSELVQMLNHISNADVNYMNQVIAVNTSFKTGNSKCNNGDRKCIRKTTLARINGEVPTSIKMTFVNY